MLSHSAAKPSEEKMARTNTNWHVVELFKDRAEKIDCKEHFSPKEFDITIEKISKVRRTRNAAYNINFHFVWIPKTREKILVDPFKSDVKAQQLFLPLSLVSIQSGSLCCRRHFLSFSL